MGVCWSVARRHRSLAAGARALKGYAGPVRWALTVRHRAHRSGRIHGTGSTLAVNGVQLGYRQFGSGSDLVLITGDTAPMSLWTPYLLKPLAHSFRVTIFDNRGMNFHAATCEGR
jgi:hypothetical protein